MVSPRRPVPWGLYGFYLVLRATGFAGSLAAGYLADLSWLAIGWAIALGLITRLLGLRQS